MKMNKKRLIAGLVLFTVAAASGLVILTPNPFSEMVISRAQAMGYVSYSADEAMALAYGRCTQCHSDEKILKYCSRCGPPFIVVTSTMRKYIDLSKTQGLEIEQFTDAEIVAITQTWNALIGNWEKDWPKKDLKKLLGRDQALIRLLEIPVEERPIEMALKNKSASGAYQRYGLGEKRDNAGQ